MVAGVGFIAHPGIYPGVLQIRTQGRVEQQMINAQAGVFLPVLAEVIPERVEPILRMQVPQ